MKYVTYKFDIEDIVPPYVFGSALTYYNIYPWIKEGECLARILELASGKVIKVEIIDTGTTNKPKLSITLKSQTELEKKETGECRSILRWSLNLDGDPNPFIRFCRKDPVLNAALEHGQIGGRGKVFPTVLEPMISSICAQRTIFKRVYNMMFNICAYFGKKIVIDGTTYHSFPSLTDLKDATEEDLRRCKTGYRASRILKLLSELNRRKIDPEGLKKLSSEEAEEILLSLPGIGPYSSKIILSVGLKRSAIHIDSYVREIMYTFFFNGKKVSDEEILNYVKTKWGDSADSAISLLTTDTEIWAKEVGYDFRLKSGAREAKNL